MRFNWNPDEIHELIRECREFIGDHYLGHHEDLLRCRLDQHGTYKSPRKRDAAWKEVEHHARLLARRINDLRHQRDSLPR